MKVFTISLLVTCLAASVSSAAPDGKGLSWNQNYGKSKQIAQATKRPMLLVLEDSTKKNQRIDESTLTTKERTILSKDKFELCRVDVTTDYGKRVAKAFGAKVFPYTVVTDDVSKRIVFRKPGQMSNKDWTLALAKTNRVPKVANPATPMTTVAPAGYRPTIQLDSTSVIQPMIPSSGTCFT